jgi:hypothetical protein
MVIFGHIVSHSVPEVLNRYRVSYLESFFIFIYDNKHIDLFEIFIQEHCSYLSVVSVENG